MRKKLHFNYRVPFTVFLLIICCYIEMLKVISVWKNAQHFEKLNFMSCSFAAS